MENKPSPRVIYRHWAFRLPLLRNYRGIVVGRRIWFKHDASEVSPELIRHELVHQRQMDQHGVWRFYGVYLKDYFVNLLRYRNHHQAYWNIPFEIEARKEET